MSYPMIRKRNKNMLSKWHWNGSPLYSTGNKDYFDCLVSCPICNKDHKKENIRYDIDGEWGSGDYVNTKTYRIKCWEAYQNSIQIVTVKA